MPTDALAGRATGNRPRGTGVESFYDPAAQAGCRKRSLRVGVDPAVADLHVGPLHRRPGGAMRDLLLARVARMRFERMVERLAIDVLRMRRQMALHRLRQVGIAAIGHGEPPPALVSIILSTEGSRRLERGQSPFPAARPPRRAL